MKFDDATERDIAARCAAVEAHLFPQIDGMKVAIESEEIESELTRIQREAIDAYRQSLVAKVEALVVIDVKAVGTVIPWGKDDGVGIPVKLVSREQILALLGVKP